MASKRRKTSEAVDDVQSWAATRGKLVAAPAKSIYAEYFKHGKYFAGKLKKTEAIYRLYSADKYPNMHRSGIWWIDDGKEGAFYLPRAMRSATPGILDEGAKQRPTPGTKSQREYGGRLDMVHVFVEPPMGLGLKLPKDVVPVKKNTPLTGYSGPIVEIEGSKSLYLVPLPGSDNKLAVDGDLSYGNGYYGAMANDHDYGKKVAKNANVEITISSIPLAPPAGMSQSALKRWLKDNEMEDYGDEFYMALTSIKKIMPDEPISLWYGPSYLDPATAAIPKSHSLTGKGKTEDSDSKPLWKYSVGDTPQMFWK